MKATLPESEAQIYHVLASIDAGNTEVITVPNCH